MRRNHIALLFILVSLMATSCSKSPFANGKPVSESRSVGHFTAINTHHNVNVTVIHSDQPHLELTCPENLIDMITTEVSGDMLFIKNENTLDWLRSYDYDINLTVFYDSLREINHASNGWLKCALGDTLVGTAFYIEDSTYNDEGRLGHVVNAFRLNVNGGSGDIDLNLKCAVFINKFINGTSKMTLKGEVAYVEHDYQSYGPINAIELKCNFVRINTSSPNNIYVSTRNDLITRIYGIGNIYYKGNVVPEIKVRTGTGQVIKIE